MVSSLRLALLALVAGLNLCTALDAQGWRQQSIYQLMTDRFARDDDLNAPCDLPARKYCGGTWRGLSECKLSNRHEESSAEPGLWDLVNKLDYIQASTDTIENKQDTQILTIVLKSLGNGFYCCLDQSSEYKR